MLHKFFFISILITATTFFTQSHTQCLDHEKSLLLQLKNELIFDSSISAKLVQWNNQRDECCSWFGVECDDAGHVISLQLDGEAISGGIGDSSSLFRFEYLEKLNLAYNEFNHSLIPRGFHNLTHLTHLNFSYADFGGQVPAEISSLRRLLSLDFSNDDYWAKPSLYLVSPDLGMLLQNLTGLRELYLDGVYIIDRGNWSHIISSYLPHLTNLSLCFTSVYGPLVPSFWQLPLSILRLDQSNLSAANPNYFANFSRLITLSLVNCGLKGYFPETIFHIPTLQNLDLTGNDELSGTIPPFSPNGSSLKSIELRYSNFSGSIPPSISNLKTLSKIDLSDSRFTGAIPSTFANLTQLVYVDLSFNFFTGAIPSTFANLTQLVYFDLSFNFFTGSLSNIANSLFGLSSILTLGLSYNQFTGQVGEFAIVNVSNLVTLDLGGNRLEGPIPNSFFQLHSLKTLRLSGNLFHGSFQLEKIQTLVNLTILDLSRNYLSVEIGVNSSSYGLPQLEVLRLASCDLYDFPDFIKHSFDMRILDLSNNRIVGEIPSWIWGTQLQLLNLSLNLFTHMQKPYHIPASLQLLDLHSNQLRGELHLPIPPTSHLRFLSLAHNSLRGSIPTSLCNADNLDLLDLSVNELSGNIPPCLLYTLIGVFNLGRNNISGHIPDVFPQYCALQIFDLNNNSLDGNMPKSLKNCESLELLNVGKNDIHGSFPCMLSPSLCVFVLCSNRFYGDVRCQKSWPDLQIVDISSNNFSGTLESINFSSWRAMILQSDQQLRPDRLGLQFLHPSSYGYPVGVSIVMKGLALELVKIWSDFTCIDFSCNNFLGEIPDAIGDLRSLHLLNLSHNALNSTIPRSLGALSKLESLDISVNQLGGTIPEELAQLTFLSFLNVSYNKLAGKIPNGRQFQTFPADSFQGNPGLYGFPLNISIRNTSDTGLSSPEYENMEAKREIEWEYVCAALGYVVGLGSIVWILVFCRCFRERYFEKIEEVVEERFGGRNRRRRRARRVVKNQVRRQ